MAKNFKEFRKFIQENREYLRIELKGVDSRWPYNYDNQFNAFELKAIHPVNGNIIERYYSFSKSNGAIMEDRELLR